MADEQAARFDFSFGIALTGVTADLDVPALSQRAVSKQPGYD
ncbi:MULTISPECIES: hypothetical protein [unclassified Bradyrhizobium]|nr:MULTISPECIES: hypothetical protein [unclassified Bradyrhizobium]